MIHRNTKYWSFTWDTNINQKKIPHEETLLKFFHRVANSCTFQYERGAEKQKEHIQGVFELVGPRQSKSSVLKLFNEDFKNIAGLTIQAVYDKTAIQAYVTKTEGRTKGPFYGGKTEMYDKEFSSKKLRTWQRELFEIISGDEQDMLRDRKVIWVEDRNGGTGKSWFQKYLRIGQKALVIRSLPVSSVDRLISAVNIIHKQVEVDAFCIDLTRTQGENQSFKDLFSTVEQIKNGFVIDVMYGKYNEAIFKPPIIMIFTNEKLEDYRTYLSEDRWVQYIIGPDGDLSKVNVDGTYTPVKFLLKNNVSLNDANHSDSRIENKKTEK